MKFSRIAFVLTLSWAAAALADAPATPATPATPPAPPAAAATGDAASLDAELDALFRPDGLTSVAAGARASTASPEVRRRAADVAQANAVATKVQLVNVPRLSGTLQYTRLSSIDPPMLGGGFTFPVFLNSYAATAELAVPLSDYVLRIPDLVASARQALVAARASQQSTAVSVAASAKLAYYEWVRANLQKVVADRSVIQVDATVGQVRSLVDAQRASRADQLRVEAQLAQARQAAAQLAGVVELRTEVLRLAIGAAPQEALAIGEDIRAALVLPAAQPIAALVEVALKRRPELQTLEAGIRAKQLQRSAESSLPRLAAFGQLNYANPNQRIVPSRDQFDLTWAVGLSLSWSLNDVLDSRATADGYDAEARGLLADRDRLIEGIRIDVVQAATNLEVARQSLETTAQGLAAAEESYRVRKELMAFERATAVELVDAEAEVTRARIAALSARVDLRVALVQLDRATGADAP